MRQSDQPRLMLRYVRATALTVVAVAILPAAFLGLGYEAMHSPDWDPNGDSGAVQGFLLFFVFAVIAVLYAGAAFPSAAALLNNQGRFSKPEFLRLLRIWLAVLSLFLALAVGAASSLVMLVPIGLLLYCVVTLLALPFAHLWFRLAK